MLALRTSVLVNFASRTTAPTVRLSFKKQNLFESLPQFSDDVVLLAAAKDGNVRKTRTSGLDIHAILISLIFRRHNNVPPRTHYQLKLGLLPQVDETRRNGRTLRPDAHSTQIVGHKAAYRLLGGMEEQVDKSTVVDYITKSLSGVETTTAYGYTFFFYRSDHKLPFATLISSDQDYDHISNLDRPGVFRLNIGVNKQTFQSLFGTAQVDVKSYDFTALDVIMPHPEYAQQYFICVLSPSDATFERIRTLLAEAYDIAEQRYTRRNKNETSAAS